MEPGAPPTATGDVPPDAPLLDDPRAAQFLATEHWSLLATRSMSWNEAFSRTGTFLSTLSAATVALALAGPAMSFGSAFPLFALVVLSVTLFLGVATFVRLTQVNHEDLYWVYGMNLLRGWYVRLVPGLRDAFIAGYTVDPAGIARTFGAIDVFRPSPLHMLITSPAVVGVISSAIAGVIGGLLVLQIGFTPEVALAVGIATFPVSVAVFVMYGIGEDRRFIARMRRLEAERAARAAEPPGGRPASSE